MVHLVRGERVVAQVSLALTREREVGGLDGHFPRARLGAHAAVAFARGVGSGEVEGGREGDQGAVAAACVGLGRHFFSFFEEGLCLCKIGL